MDDFEQVIENIAKSSLTAAVKLNEPLSNHTTFKIGGRVRAMYFPDSCDSLMQLHKMLGKAGVVPKIIGRGSNILAGGKDLDIIVIKTTGMRSVVLTDTVITAQCGATLYDTSLKAKENALTGLEFAQGIPGTLGGAVVMNAGAYGGEMKDVIIETTAINPEKGIYTVKNEEHEFSYRSSIFAENDDIILSSKLKLQQGSREQIEEKTAGFEKKRRESQPLDRPSAGSTFKRPKEGFAAALIDEAGLRGYRIGGAQVSEKHAGFIINTGGATFDDVMRLIEYVQETVEARTGVKLEPEVKIWNW